MRLLVITNLYPPQELGGYGRAIADFVWGLKKLGHDIEVLTSDAPYLGPSTPEGPSQEHVDRRLKLKGSYNNGVQELTDVNATAHIDRENKSIIDEILPHEWDALIVGNLDLLGPEILPFLLSINKPLLHHIGFIAPPFHPHKLPISNYYKIVPSSHAVAHSLRYAGFPVDSNSVVYPGARVELFGRQYSNTSIALHYAVKLALSGVPIGSPCNPLKIGFAGLLMNTKGAHTVVQAVILLKNRGIHVQACIAGDSFQAGYKEALQEQLSQADLLGLVSFVGLLDRAQLARFWNLHHIGIFASTYPEAFGIVAAEIMASGIVLFSSGVGGAAELIEHSKSGLLFEANNPVSLANQIQSLITEPLKMQEISESGQKRANQFFSVDYSAKQLESLCSRSYQS